MRSAVTTIRRAERNTCFSSTWNYGAACRGKDALQICFEKFISRETRCDCSDNLLDQLNIVRSWGYAFEIVVYKINELLGCEI